MKWEILVVTIHVGGVGLWDGLIECHRALDCFVLGVKHLRHITLELIPLGLDVLDGEADDCAADLHSHGVLRLQTQLLLQQDDRAELRRVVLDVEAVLLALDDGVTPTDGDVVDTHLTLVATAEFELRLLRSDRKKMDISRGVLVQRHRLK